MSNPIFKSAYNAAQIEAAIDKGPRVNSSGYWEVWNVETMAYESTGVGAGVKPPTVVTLASQMTNHGYIYIYNGSETGYTPGYWYYWDGSAWTAGGAYQVAATDPTLSVAGAAADAKATGDAVGELKSALIDNGYYNYACDANKAPATSNGVSFIANGNDYSIVGTSTGVSAYYLFDEQQIRTFDKGKSYHFVLENGSTDIILQFYKYVNGSMVGVDYGFTDKWVTIPTDADGVVFRIRVGTGSTVNTTVSLKIYEGHSPDELYNMFADAVTFGGTLPNGTDLNSVKGVVKYYTLSSPNNYTNTPPEFNLTWGGILFVYKAHSNSSTLQRFINIDPNGKNWQRFYVNSTDRWTSWNDTLSDIDSAFEDINTTFEDINTTLSMFDVKDLMWANINPSNRTSAGVSWTVNKSQKSITVDSNGLASTGISFINLHYDLSALPSWLKKGKRYFAQINSENVYFEIFYHDNDTSVDTWLFSTNKPIEFVIPNEATNLVIRLRTRSGDTVDEVVTPFISEAMTLSELTDKVYHRSLKILFMGHSLLQDECTYVPWILESVAPDLDLTMAIAYKDSAWISKQNGFNAHFDDTTYKMSVYSKYNSHDTKWTNSNNTYTIKDALDAEEWDAVVICESLLYNTADGIPSSDTTHFAAVGEFVDKIISYVKHPLKIGVMFPHDRYCTSDYTTVLEKPTTYTESATQYKNCVWDAYPVEFFIPGFTAYWNARGTVLDEYGDKDFHHMLADMGHYQEGIGCLLGSYTSAAVLLSIAGFDSRSIFGDQLPITSQWISDHAIPGQNLGPQSRPTGIESENLARNRLIAQKCAIMAIKRPWEISTIS